MPNLHHARVKARHTVALVALILLLLALPMAWHRPPLPPEPTFGGRTLTEWALLDPNARNDNPRSLEARAAVRAIGTNALPCLLAWLSRDPKPDPLRQTAKLVFPDISGFKSVRSWAEYDPAVIHFEVVPLLFGTLGPDAAPAIPELERLASDPRGRKSAYTATSSLAGIGPKALPALERIAANPACPTHNEAARAIKRVLDQSSVGDSASH